MTSQWIKGYSQASFRGVEFFIKGHSHSGGRRIATHIFPEREKPSYEDLGEKEQPYSLNAYILGDNYWGQRNELKDALNLEGPGLLVHPYFGTMTVVCDSYTLTETTAEGRKATFNITFKKDEGAEVVIIAPDSQAEVFLKKESLLDTIQAWLEDVYTLAQQPVKAIEDVNAVLNDALDVVDSAKRIANTQADFKRALSNTRGKLIELSISATAIAQDFKALLSFGTDPSAGTGLSATQENSPAQLTELKPVTAYADTPINDTPEEIALDPDYPSFQIQQTVALTAVAAMGGLFTFVEFDSVQQAEEDRKDFFDIMNKIMVDPNLDDSLYESLRDFKAAIHTDIETRALDLPRLISYDLPDQTNTLQLSNELYGSIEEEADLIARNDIEQPGFVSMAEPLEVKIYG
jgi:prophage DNA circulation protein